MTQSNNFAKLSTLEIAELLISSGNAEDEIRDFVYSNLSCDDYLAVCNLILEKGVSDLAGDLLTEGVEREIIDNDRRWMLYEERGEYDKALHYLLEDPYTDYIDSWLFLIENNQTKLQATIESEEFESYMWAYIGNIPDGHDISNIDGYGLLLPFAKFCCLAKNIELLKDCLDFFECWGGGRIYC